MKTEKFKPNGKKIKPETRFTEFTALPVEPGIRISQSASEPMFDYFA